MLESLNSFKFIMAALNLIILYFILRKILFKPVTEFMEKRTKAIQDSIDDAEKRKAEAVEMQRMYAEQLKSAKAEGERIVDDAVKRASQQAEAIADQARLQAQELLTRAREEIEYERGQMLRDIQNQVASLALAAASKVVEANMDTESNRRLVDKFIDEAGAA